MSLNRFSPRLINADLATTVPSLTMTVSICGVALLFASDSEVLDSPVLAASVVSDSDTVSLVLFIAVSLPEPHAVKNMMNISRIQQWLITDLLVSDWLILDWPIAE